MAKRLRKEHMVAMLKIHLNRGQNKVKDILSEYEMRLLDDLVSEGYVGIENKSYAYLTGSGEIIGKAADDFIDAVSRMYESGYMTRRTDRIKAE